MAEGYAKWRPPVHPYAIGLIQERLGIRSRLGCALDAGCGSGLSTAPLERIAERVAGVDPVETMLRAARAIAPRASFLAGTAEALPVRSQSVDLVTAAGSLNYTDQDRSLAEIRRVLKPGGVLAAYDFSPGRRMAGSDTLDRWYGEFLDRYPPPAYPQLRLGALVKDPFEVGLRMEAESYLNYVMTEAGVAEAVNHGTPVEEIRSWCAATLARVFGSISQVVLFQGYIAYIQ